MNLTVKVKLTIISVFILTVFFGKVLLLQNILANPPVSENKHIMIAQGLNARQVDLIEQAFEISIRNFLKNPEISYVFKNGEDELYSLYVSANQITYAIEALRFFSIEDRFIIPDNEQMRFLASEIDFNDSIYDYLIDKTIIRYENYFASQTEETLQRLLNTRSTLEYLIERALDRDIESIKWLSFNIVDYGSDGFLFSALFDFYEMPTEYTLEYIQGLLKSNFSGIITEWHFIGEWSGFDFKVAVAGNFRW